MPNPVVSPVFARILVASQVEDAITASLKKWFPTYLREVERQIGLNPITLKTPTNYTERNTFDGEAGEELPKVVVISPGIIGAPTKVGNGRYSAQWRIGVGVAIGAETEDEADIFVKSYGAAVRGILLQNSGLGNLGATDIWWTDESYDDIPITNLVQLVKAASLYFTVEITDVVTRKPGPQTPDENVYDYGQVQTADVTLEKVPITDTL